MKRFILLLAALCIALFLPVRPAQAQEIRYARITQPNVYLYEQADAASGLFVLPQTYFVKITGEIQGYYSAEYLCDTAGRTPVRGYCRIDEVELVDYIPETPFLIYDTDVTFRTSDSYLPDDFISEYRVSAAFYGTFSYGSSVCYYVLLNGTFGYVPASACPPLSYPENTEHTELEEPVSAPSDTPAPGLSAVNVVLISALAVAALGAVYFLFRPAKQQTRPFDEDIEEFF